MDEHGRTEHAKDNVSFPADGGKRNGREQSQCRVEGPVTGGRQGHSLTTDAQWVDLPVPVSDWIGLSLVLVLTHRSIIVRLRLR